MTELGRLKKCHTLWCYSPCWPWQKVYYCLLLYERTCVINCIITCVIDCVITRVIACAITCVPEQSTTDKESLMAQMVLIIDWQLFSKVDIWPIEMFCPLTCTYFCNSMFYSQMKKCSLLLLQLPKGMYMHHRGYIHHDLKLYSREWIF